jgi:hypothetical protein
MGLKATPSYFGTALTGILEEQGLKTKLLAERLATLGCPTPRQTVETWVRYALVPGADKFAFLVIALNLTDGERNRLLDALRADYRVKKATSAAKEAS